jgi:mannose-6-phosphate isomerase-like protein (cupin superfamily)
MIAPRSRELRRIVTGHDERGRAVIVADGTPPHTVRRDSTGTVSWPLWVADETPASLHGNHDRGVPSPGIAPPIGGSVFRIVDFPPVADEAALAPALMATAMGAEHAPGGHPPRHPLMHRTRTLDYGVVLSGEIDMLLDDSEVRLRAGDVIVQRGTNHAWVNRGSEPCRIAFVLIDARPVEGADDGD